MTFTRQTPPPLRPGSKKKYSVPTMGQQQQQPVGSPQVPPPPCAQQPRQHRASSLLSSLLPTRRQHKFHAIVGEVPKRSDDSQRLRHHSVQGQHPLHHHHHQPKSSVATDDTGVSVAPFLSGGRWRRSIKSSTDNHSTSGVVLKGISSSTPSSPVAERKRPIMSNNVPLPVDVGGGVSQNNVSEKSTRNERKPRKSFSAFIRRSLSRSRGRSANASPSPPPEQPLESNHFRSISQQQDAYCQLMTAAQAAAPPPPPQLTFAQRIKLHKGLRTGNVPVELLQQKAQLERQQQQRKREKQLKSGKTSAAEGGRTFDPRTADVDSTTYLTEALLAIADSQPTVARSTPKHATSLEMVAGAGGTCGSGGVAYHQRQHDLSQRRRVEERLRRDCLFEPDFYDQMLRDSLLVCDLLQDHLASCIQGVRAHSPSALSSPFTSPPQTPVPMIRSLSSQPVYSSDTTSGIGAGSGGRTGWTTRVDSNTAYSTTDRHQNSPYSATFSPTSSQPAASSVLSSRVSSPMLAASRSYDNTPASSPSMSGVHRSKGGITAGQQQLPPAPPRVRISLSGGCGGPFSTMTNQQHFRQPPTFGGPPRIAGSGSGGNLMRANVATSVPYLAAASLPPIPIPPERKKITLSSVHFAA